MKIRGSYLIKKERERQIETEGYTDEYDKQFDVETLIKAALAYAEYDINDEMAYYTWPWDIKNNKNKSFKPSTLKRNLIKAGALIAAAIDRLEDDEEENDRI